MFEKGRGGDVENADSAEMYRIVITDRKMVFGFFCFSLEEKSMQSQKSSFMNKTQRKKTIYGVGLLLVKPWKLLNRRAKTLGEG